MISDDTATEGLFGRTWSSLRSVWRLWGQANEAPEALSEPDLVKIRQEIDDCLTAKGGEVSARARAAQLGYRYLAFGDTGRAQFLRLLAEEYDIDDQVVLAAFEAFAAAEPGEDQRYAMRQLRTSIEAPRVRLLKQFNGLPQGIKFLVDMRAELVKLARNDPAMQSLDDDLRDLLESWFDIGFLELRSITWQAPAALLEKLIEYEAVHEVRSWQDLRNRLEPDRRCFAFFHPQMPDEPLIFVEVALVKGIADNVQLLLDEGAPQHDPMAADTAIFYSISNAQSGLAGVGFGDFLIKRVVALLSAELPNIKTFATLSPVPGFLRWLEGQMATDALSWLREAETSLPAPVMTLLQTNDWHEDSDLATALQPLLLRACAQYLLTAKRHEQVHDRVQHFHLSNGASLDRINWLANPSAAGLQQSAGIMVNYRYNLKDIENNYQNYVEQHGVAASAAVRKLAQL